MVPDLQRFGIDFLSLIKLTSRPRPCRPTGSVGTVESESGKGRDTPPPAMDGASMDGSSRFHGGFAVPWPRRQDLKTDRSPLKRIAEPRPAATAQAEPRDLDDRRSPWSDDSPGSWGGGGARELPELGLESDPADFFGLLGSNQPNRQRGDETDFWLPGFL